MSNDPLPQSEMILYQTEDGRTRIHCRFEDETVWLSQAQMADLKASHIAEAGETIASATDLVPPVVMGVVSRTTIRSMRRFGQQSLNTVTTNVPGPQFPLYCLGREMLEYRPYVPISHGLRVGTAILSYNGRLFFGVTGDFRTTPDVPVLADEAATGIEDLRELALERLGDHRPS